MAVKNANSPAIVQAPELLERVILCKEQPLLLVLLLALWVALKICFANKSRVLISGEGSGKHRGHCSRCQALSLLLPAASWGPRLVGPAPCSAGQVEGGRGWGPGRPDAGGSREPQPRSLDWSRVWGYRHGFCCSGRAAASLLSRRAGLLRLARSLPVSISVLRAPFAFGTAVLLLPRGPPPGPSRAQGAPVGALYPHLSFASCRVHFWAARAPACMRPRKPPVLPCVSRCLPGTSPFSPLPHSPPHSLDPRVHSPQKYEALSFSDGIPSWVVGGQRADFFFFLMPVPCSVNCVCVCCF